MTKELEDLASKMAESEYPLPERNDFMIDRQIIYVQRNEFLAGFTARDEMDSRIREEHAEMLETLKAMLATFFDSELSYPVEKIQSLITKISTP